MRRFFRFMEEFAGLFFFLGIVLLIAFLAWQGSQPREVVVNGVHCIESGTWENRAISCDWNKEK